MALDSDFFVSLQQVWENETISRICLSVQDSRAYFHLLEQIAPDGSKEDVPKIEIEMSGVFVSYPSELPLGTKQTI